MHKPFISKPVKPFLFVFDVVKKQKVFPEVDMINRIMKVKFVKNKQNIPSRKLKKSAKSYIACFRIADTSKF